MRNRDRRVVEQAKAVLMLRYGTGSYEALGLMARWSSEAGVSVGATARALVDAICQGRAPASGEEAALVRLVEQRLRAVAPELHLTATREPDSPGARPPDRNPTDRNRTEPTRPETRASTASQTTLLTEKEIAMEQTPPRVPEQREPVDDLDLEGMAESAEAAPTGHHHHTLRELAGGFSDRRWRYSNALEAARRLSSGGGRPAASSG